MYIKLRCLLIRVFKDKFYNRNIYGIAGLTNIHLKDTKATQKSNLWIKENIFLREDWTYSTGSW